MISKIISTIIITMALVSVIASPNAFGQILTKNSSSTTMPPILENTNSNPMTNNGGAAVGGLPSIGKVIIPISVSEQIIIDLPIQPDSQIKIVPIK
jgi:hypothetical protein